MTYSVLNSCKNNILYLFVMNVNFDLSHTVFDVLIEDLLDLGKQIATIPQKRAVGMNFHGAEAHCGQG